MERPAQKSSRIAGLYFAVLALFPGAVTFASRPTESSLVQQAPEVAERFEVIAIHPSGEKNDRPSLQFLPGGVLRAENASLKLLIEAAYGVRDEQVSGGDRWSDSERFDVL